MLALTSDYGWWGTDANAPRGLGTLTNQYAAMPSMHVGWAVWCGLTIAAAIAGRRSASLAYPVLAAVVVVTGNHFVLDAVAWRGPQHRPMTARRVQVSRAADAPLPAAVA